MVNLHARQKLISLMMLDGGGHHPSTRPSASTNLPTSRTPPSRSLQRRPSDTPTQTPSPNASTFSSVMAQWNHSVAR